MIPEQIKATIETSVEIVPAWAATLYDLLHEIIKGRCRGKEEYERLKLKLDALMKEVAR